MIKNLSIIFSLLLLSVLSGCATVPMAAPEEDTARKSFNSPSQGMSGLYIYRNSNLGGALKKSLYIDGEFVGESAPYTYFFREVSAGEHRLSTESEFSDNDLVINTVSGQNYFVRQYIKLGLFVGGANLELMSEEEGKAGVLECKLAK